MSTPFRFGLPDKPVVVYGFGLTGRGTAQALKATGLTVWGLDDSAVIPAEFAPPAGPLPWDQVGALIKSPGIEMQAPAVQAARAAGVPVLGDVDLLWRRVQATDGALPSQVIGITGTNGKSTTTALVGHVLRSAGYNVAVGGNIGEASLNLPPLTMDEQGRQGVYVLELSSYQLEMTQELAVDGGIFLNLTPDHLTRHGTMENYCAAKYKLFQLAQHGATLALGVDQPILRALAQRPDFVGLTVNAGLGENAAAADYMVRAGALWRGLDKLMPLDDLPHLQGPHNAQNVACAYALLVPRWVTAAQFAAAAKSFRGLPHRLEKVGMVAGVDFVNDSKATNGDSAVYALQSFKNIYWICGGLPKSDGLGACVEHLGAVRAAFCIGVAAADFARELAARGVVVFPCGTLDVAVREAFATARTENLTPATVLLAPAAASQDQFRNFEHRGDVFVNCVQALALPKVGAGRG